MTTQNDLPVVIRDLSEEDKTLVLDSWSQSSRYNSTVNFWVPRRQHLSKYAEMVAKLMDFCPWLFHVACHEDDATQIFGWCCRDSRCVHFVYVKQDYRGYGIAKLLTKGQKTVSQWTKDCDDKGLTYQPKYFREIVKNAENRSIQCDTKQIYASA